MIAIIAALFLLSLWVLFGSSGEWRSGSAQMPHRQKSKGRKRPRAWHHTAAQDKVFIDADRIFDTRPSFTCPRCRSVSYNPNDIREGYCGRCHDWTDTGR